MFPPLRRTSKQQNPNKQTKPKPLKTKHQKPKPVLFRLKSTQTFKQAIHKVEEADQQNILLAITRVSFGRNFCILKDNK